MLVTTIINFSLDDNTEQSLSPSAYTSIETFKVNSFHYVSFNPSLEDKILAMPKLKAFAEDNFNLAQMVKFLFEKV